VWAGTLNGFAQTSRTLSYYDKNWQELSLDTANWQFKREVVLESGKTLLNVSDFYRNGNKQMSGTFLQLEPEIKEGEFSWYYENGKLMKKARFVQGVQEGIEEEFTENSLPLFVRTFKKGKLHGAVNCFRPNGKKWLELYFENDSLLPTRNRIWDLDGKEIEYEKYLKKTDKKARGFTSKLQNGELSGDITMPEPLNLLQVKSRIVYNTEQCPVEGKVFCRLKVDKYGRVVSHTILRSPNDCLTQAVEAHLKHLYFLPGRSPDCIFEADVSLPFSFRFSK